MPSRHQYQHYYLKTLTEGDLQSLSERCQQWGMHPVEFAKRLSNWLANFDDEADYALALKVIYAIEYFNEQAFHDLLVPRHKAVQRHIIDHNLDAARIWFAVPDDLADSATRHAHPLSKVWQLPDERFISFSAMGGLAGLGMADTLVLYSDTYGSGKQFMRNVWPQLAPRVAQMGAVIILGGAIAAQALALFKREALGANIIPNYAAPSLKSLNFTDAEVARLTELGSRVYAAHPQGFGACALLLAYHFQCPNNSLPLIWANGQNNAVPGKPTYPWTALFPYRPKTRPGDFSPAQSPAQSPVLPMQMGRLSHLQLEHIGPAASMSLAFGSRLNLITGDNGLGKSFLLDIVWWALTDKWPTEINPGLLAGKMALPRAEAASIDFAVTVESGEEVFCHSTFGWQQQAWSERVGPPINPGLVLYSMSDGSFAVWDPARNYSRGLPVSQATQERPLAYVFNPNEVWNGLLGNDGRWLCNGLIRDWTSWQREDGRAFQGLCAVLKALSPSTHETMVPGALTRISLNDVRDIPTIRMSYGEEVPVLHASSGMRRIITLAYLLVWCWEEHMAAATMTRESNSKQMTVLIDEVEAHLHPKWQRKIVPALLNVMQALNPKVQVQTLIVTHSPLVMASVEPWFDPASDVWFDLDFQQGDQRKAGVVLENRPFVLRGDATNWLMSPAFDLASARSLEAEQALQQAAKAMGDPQFTPLQAKNLRNSLRAVLSDTDPFWLRLDFVGQQKGWWQ